MDNRELEKILRSFKKVKAPEELDERLLPYLSNKKNSRRRSYVIAIATAGIVLSIALSSILKRKRPSTFFYEPLYAAYMVPGYFQTSVVVTDGGQLKVILDGYVMEDTTVLSTDTLNLEFDTSSGLHYLIIEVRDNNGNLKYTRTLDIYSL